MSKESLPAVEDLYPGCLDMKAVWVEDWSEWLMNDDAVFYEAEHVDSEIYEISDELKEQLPEDGILLYPRDSELLDDIGVDVSGPMMMYYWPIIDVGDPEEAARKLMGLPMIPVSLPDSEEEDWGIAFTGGGMDLSWELAASYMLLGFLPPTAVANLPAMSGYPRGAFDRWVLEGCKKSLRVSAEMSLHTLKFLEERFRE